MKKFLLLVCCLGICFGCLGCRSKEPEILVPVQFYYCSDEISYNSPVGVIRPEIREGAQFDTDLEAMLREYFNGPESSELFSPFPLETGMISVSTDGSTASLMMNAQFSRLSGIKLTTASVCILKTMNEYAGVDTVQFQVQNGLIDGRDVFIISMDDIILMDIGADKES